MHPGSPAYHSTPCALSVIYMQRAGGSTIMYSRNRAWNSQSLYHVCNHAITLSLTQSTLNHHKMTAHARISNHAITQSRNHAITQSCTPITHHSNHELLPPNTKHQTPTTNHSLTAAFINPLQTCPTSISRVLAVHLYSALSITTRPLPLPPLLRSLLARSLALFGWLPPHFQLAHCTIKLRTNDSERQ